MIPRPDDVAAPERDPEIPVVPDLWILLASLSLSPRQYEVMRALYVRKWSPRRTAANLGISVKTVRNYRQRAVMKYAELRPLYSNRVEEGDR